MHTTSVKGHGHSPVDKNKMKKPWLLTQAVYKIIFTKWGVNIPVCLKLFRTINDVGETRIKHSKRNHFGLAVEEKIGGVIPDK